MCFFCLSKIIATPGNSSQRYPKTMSLDSIIFIIETQCQMSLLRWAGIILKDSSHLYSLNAEPRNSNSTDLYQSVRKRPSPERPFLEMHKSHPINSVVCLGFSLRVILCIYTCVVLWSPAGTRWSNTPFLPLEVSWRRILSSIHHLKLASEAISASSVLLLSPSWAIANRLSIKLHREWCFASVWVWYVCSVNFSICLVFPIVFC